MKRTLTRILFHAGDVSFQRFRKVLVLRIQNYRDFEKSIRLEYHITHHTRQPFFSKVKRQPH